MWICRCNDNKKLNDHLRMQITTDTIIWSAFLYAEDLHLCSCGQG
jgi:hypothetical protein